VFALNDYEGFAVDYLKWMKKHPNYFGVTLHHDDHAEFLAREPAATADIVIADDEPIAPIRFSVSQYESWTVNVSHTRVADGRHSFSAEFIQHLESSGDRININWGECFGSVSEESPRAEFTSGGPLHLARWKGLVIREHDHRVMRNHAPTVGMAMDYDPGSDGD